MCVLLQTLAALVDKVERPPDAYGETYEDWQILNGYRHSGFLSLIGLLSRYSTLGAVLLPEGFSSGVGFSEPSDGPSFDIVLPF